MPRVLVLALLLIAVTACWVRTQSALIDPSMKLVRLCPDGVKLFRSESEIDSPYRAVALLRAQASTSYSSEAAIIEALREKAADVGGNGVVLESVREPGALTQIIGEVAKTGTLRKGDALAVYIPADSARVQVACSRRK